MGAHFGVEGCDEHQGLVQQLVDAGGVGFNALHAVASKGSGGVAQQANGLQQAVDHHGFEHVELKMALGSRHADAHVVANDLPRRT